MTPKCLQRRFGCWNTSGPRKEASQLHNTARTSKYYKLQYTSLQLCTMSNCSHNDSTLKWQVDQQKTSDHCGTITARSAILISKVYLNVGQFPEVLETGYKRFSNSEYGCTNVLSIIETHINDQKYKFSKCFWGILKSVYHVCAHKVSAVQNVGQSLLEDLKTVALTLKAATVTLHHTSSTLNVRVVWSWQTMSQTQQNIQTQSVHLWTDPHYFTCHHETLRGLPPGSWPGEEVQLLLGPPSHWPVHAQLTTHNMTSLQGKIHTHMAHSCHAYMSNIILICNNSMQHNHSKCQSTK